MEIKEGMYVRTSSGIISKILDEEFDIRYKFDMGINYPFLKNGKYNNQITKYSFNIIDLIKEGDYVNGYKVLNVTNQYIELNNPSLNYDCIEFEKNFKNKFLNCSFLSIVTKEQFERISYKIKDWE